MTSFVSLQLYLKKETPSHLSTPPKNPSLQVFPCSKKLGVKKKTTHFAKFWCPQKLVFLSRMDSCQKITVSCPSHENRAMARVQCLKAAMVPHDLATCSQQIPCKGWGNLGSTSLLFFFKRFFARKKTVSVHGC